MEALQDFGENTLVGLAIRMRYEYVNISTRGLSSSVRAARHGHQVWVYSQSSILHLHRTQAVIHLSFILSLWLRGVGPTNKESLGIFQLKSQASYIILTALRDYRCFSHRSHVHFLATGIRGKTSVKQYNMKTAGVVFSVLAWTGIDLTYHDATFKS